MSVPIARNVAGQEIGIALYDGSDIKTTPTIAAGDIQISMDFAACENITAAEDPAGSGQVKLSPTQAQTNAVHLGIRWIDQAGAEWDDGYYSIFTETTTIGAIGTALTAIAATLATILADIGDVCSCVTGWFAKNISALTNTQPGDAITIRRGDTLTLSIENLGDISTRTDIWFTVKEDLDDADTAAWIQISETVGLEYINGVAATVAGNGSITVTDAVAGDITIVLAAVESAKLQTCGKLFYDIQVLFADGTVSTLVANRAMIVRDTTRVTS